MKAGKKKNKGTTEKITKFPVEAIEMEDLDDEELDALLEEELKREADELEARLNSDPKLIGVGASDDLFAKIVASLKEQGVWEEDEAEAKKREESEYVSKKADVKVAKERVCVSKKADVKEAEESEYVSKKANEEEAKESEYVSKKADVKEAKERVCVSEKADAEEIKERDEEVILSKTAAVTENGGRMEQPTELTAGMLGRDTEQNTGKKAEKIIEKDTEENIESKRTEKKNGVEAAEFSREEKEGKDPAQERYVQLSEEDRRAMEYGYEMQQKDAAKKVRRKKRRKIAKRAGITAAALVAVFGVSMTSDANRKYVLERWNTVVGNGGIKIEFGYSEKNVLRENYTEEEKAQSQIKEKLGIEPVKLKYLPDGWNYFSCEIDKNALSAIMYYEKDDMWFTVRMYKNEKENILYNQYDGKPQKIDSIKNSQGLNIDLYRNGEKEEEGYTIVFNDDDNCYYCNGRVSYEEMRKIAENIAI